MFIQLLRYIGGMCDLIDRFSIDNEPVLTICRDIRIGNHQLSIFLLFIMCCNAVAVSWTSVIHIHFILLVGLCKVILSIHKQCGLLIKQVTYYLLSLF
jgi:hypothetical protein